MRSMVALLWRPAHAHWFPRLMRQLAPAAELAVRVSRNFDATSDVCIAESVRAGSWRERLALLLRRSPFASPPGVYDGVLACRCAMHDIAETRRCRCSTVRTRSRRGPRHLAEAASRSGAGVAARIRGAPKAGPCGRSGACSSLPARPSEQIQPWAKRCAPTACGPGPGRRRGESHAAGSAVDRQAGLAPCAPSQPWATNRAHTVRRFNSISR